MSGQSHAKTKLHQIGGLGVASIGLPIPALATSVSSETPAVTENTGAWKNVELTTHVDHVAEAATEVWIPLPLAQSSYQKLLSTTWSGNFTKAAIVKDPVYGADVFYAQWDKPQKLEMSLTHQVALRNREGVELVTADQLPLYLKATNHVQTDGIVKETAVKILGKEKNSDRKAQLIYNWMVDNTARDGKVRGCGLGDVKTTLVSDHATGKCADLSSLFVGLCRASGIPAREVFGLRVLNSEVSKSIGRVGDVSKGQHCRAEYYSDARKAWVPVDPADVRKVILEETLTLKDPHVVDVRKKLFGSWEMNWIAYNSARDFDLPNHGPEKINFLMYPLLVTGKESIDGMEPDKFKYSIASKLLA